MEDNRVLDDTRTVPCTKAAYILLAALVLSTGCAGTYILLAKGPPTGPRPDPLAGWALIHQDQVHKAIVDDYHDYVQALSPRERHNVGEFNIHFFRDGTGQHAVKISIPLDGVWTEHV